MNRRTKKRLLALGVAAVVVVAGGVVAVLGRTYQQDRRASIAYEKGMSAYDRADYETALRGLSTYISRNKDDAEAMYRFADCRWRIDGSEPRHLVAATTLAREAAALAPDDPRPLVLLLDLYPRIGYVTEYRDVAERLLALESDHRDALYALVEASIELREPQAAIGRVNRWIDDHPSDVETAILKAELLASFASPEQAAAYAGSLAKIHPADPRPLLNLARLDLSRSDPESAAARLREAAAIPAPDVETMIRMIEFIDRLNAADANGELDLAGLSTQIIDAHASDPDVADAARLYESIRSWKRGGDHDIPDIATESLASLPTAVAGWAGFLLAQEQSEDERLRRIKTELSSRDAPDSRAWLHVFTARELLREGDLAAAREELTLAVGTNPRNLAASYVLAKLEAGVGEWRRSLDRLEAIASPSGDPLWIHPIITRIETLTDHAEAAKAQDLALGSIGHFRDEEQVGIRLTLLWIDAVLAQATQDRMVESDLDRAAAQAQDQRMRRGALGRVARGELGDALRRVSHGGASPARSPRSARPGRRPSPRAGRGSRRRPTPRTRRSRRASRRRRPRCSPS